MASYIDIIKGIRRSLRDEDANRYSDTMLASLIDEAQREYALDTNLLVGECDIVIDSNGEFELPEDFIKVLKVEDTNGFEIDIVTWRRLVEDFGGGFIDHIGKDLKCLCLDLCSSNKMRCYPKLENSGAIVGRMRYARYPEAGIIEFEDTRPIVDYVMFYINMIEENKDFGIYYNTYKSSVKRALLQYSETKFVNPNTRGRYY